VGRFLPLSGMAPLIVGAAKGRKLMLAALYRSSLGVKAERFSQNVGSVVALLHPRRRMLLDDRRRLRDRRGGRLSPRHLVVPTGGEKAGRRQCEHRGCCGLHEVLLVIPRIRSSWSWSSSRPSARKENGLLRDDLRHDSLVTLLLRVDGDRLMLHRLSRHGVARQVHERPSFR